MINFLFHLFDTRTECQKMASDRNLILTGYGSKWMVLSADGDILSTASTQVSALTKAIFKDN